MAEDTKKRNKRQYEWIKQNMTQVSMKFHNVNDADILTAIADAPVKGTELKRLIRVGIAAEKKSAP